MDNKYRPLVFISYRRQDTAPAARLLSRDLRAIFGLGSVFIDTNDIRIGTDWSARINERLKATSVLLVVIGPNWLRISDDAGRRRLDQTEDWVRNEIGYAIDNKLVVIPCLVAGASLPDKKALPRRIARLADQQAIKVDYESWDSDLRPLVSVLEEIGFRRTEPDNIPLPGHTVGLKTLAEAEIDDALQRLPEWQITSTLLPGKEPSKRTELTRMYEFASFEDAVEFIAEAARYISAIDHHPRWENTWRTVRVWLTTWNTEYKPSQYDLKLAEYLDNLFAKYSVLRGKS